MNGLTNWDLESFQIRVYMRTYALKQMIQAASSSAGLRTIKRVWAHSPRSCFFFSSLNIYFTWMNLLLSCQHDLCDRNSLWREYWWSFHFISKQSALLLIIFFIYYHKLLEILDRPQFNLLYFHQLYYQLLSVFWDKVQYHYATHFYFVNHLN